MKHERITTGKRRPVNLSLGDETVASARELGLNLSETCDRLLAAEVKAERQRRWKEENRAAMEAWNVWLEKNGLPYANLRVW